jgi:hypothetical protein
MGATRKNLQQLDTTPVLGPVIRGGCAYRGSTRSQRKSPGFSALGGVNIHGHGGATAGAFWMYSGVAPPHHGGEENLRTGRVQLPRTRMNKQRRGLVKALVAAGGGLAMPARAAEPPPETGRLRIGKLPIVPQAPKHLAEQLRRAEVFEELRRAARGRDRSRRTAPRARSSTRRSASCRSAGGATTTRMKPCASTPCARARRRW